jgi:L-ribulose-5-phosphate 4-epimerase
MLDALKAAVYEANMMLHRAGLAPETWGNASGIDRGRGIVGIKPSGVPYGALAPDQIVLVDLEGKVVEGTLRPSSDTPTHLELYRAFASAGGVAHAHSPAATAFAQAERSIPCFGTTHADHFDGTVPVSRRLTAEEVRGAYELNTGAVIVETFTAGSIDPARMPAILVAGHGPFTWGLDAAAAVTNAIVLEAVAAMARDTILLRVTAALPVAPPSPIPEYLLRKHFDRKHGPGAYYGQR